MSKIAVLGADGFIGHHLVEKLAQNSGDQIVAFDRFSKYRDTNDLPFGTLTNVSVVLGDFLNRDDINSALASADYVFHFVSSTNPATSSNDPFIDIDTNVRGTVELLKLCAEHKVKKVIFPSSGGTVYGDVQAEHISEAELPKPRSPYGIGKLTIEHFLRYFKFNFGVDYVVYRVANPYGPGQNIYGKQGVIPIFMHKFLDNEPVTIYGDGSMVRDYIYIDDLVNMICRSYDKPCKHSEYNLGSGTGVSVAELLAAIEATTGRTPEKNYVDTPVTFVQKSLLDIDRFENEFGKQSFTPLESGLERTWDYVKQLG